MKNRKLFDAIEKMVEEKTFQIKKNNKPTNFAADYCQRQLIKKKLIPKDPRIKMNKLMKNFQQLQTFVNVDELINCLNQIYKQQKKNQHLQPVIVPEKKIEKHKRYDSEGNDSLNMNSMRRKLRTFYKQRNLKETEQMKEIMKKLQSTSQMKKQKYKNNSQEVLHHLFERVKNEEERIVKEDDLNKNKVAWNQYCAGRNHQAVENNFVKEQQILKSERKIDDNLEELEKQKLLSLAGTYLQIILEKNHRKKWKYEKRNENLIKKDITAAQMKSKLKTQKQLQKKIVFKQTFHSSKNSTLTRHSTIKSTKKFRSNNNNPKSIAMRQLTTFLTNLDDNQMIMKRKNKDDIGQIAGLEKKIKNDYEQYEGINVAEEEDVQKIITILQSQK